MLNDKMGDNIGCMKDGMGSSMAEKNAVADVGSVL